MKKGSGKKESRKTATKPGRKRYVGNGPGDPERAGGHPAPVMRPGCSVIGREGSCIEWEGLLPRFPMIDSVQREDFPEHGASFVYLAHLYRTRDTPEESSRAQQEFEDFFRSIGYEYRSSGNYDSRWYEGIGVHTDDSENPGPPEEMS